MSRARKKSISVVVVLAMLATMLFAFAGTASAATTYTALSAPTVAPDNQNHALGTVEIKIDSLVEDSSALISLPSGFNFNLGATPPGTVYDWVYTPLGGSTVNVTLTPTGSSNEAMLNIDLTGPVADNVKVFVRPGAVTVPTGASGDITLTIKGLSGQLPDGSVVVGKAGPGQVTVAAGTPVTFSSAGTSGGAIAITLTETAAGALKVHDNSVKFILPYGFSWKAGALATELTTTAWDGTVVRDVYDPRVLYLDVNAASSSPSKAVVRITADIAVDETKAKFGDVDVVVTGVSSVSPSSLVIGKYADYGVTVKAENATEILAGRLEQKIGDIVFEETAPESAVDGRAITLTLPKGAKWTTIANNNVVSERGFDIERSGGNVVVTPVGTDGRVIKLIVDQTDTGTSGKLTLKGLKVDVAVNFSGPLEVEIGGNAGVSGKVTVANAIAPVSLTAEKKDVVIGLSKQAAGDLVIKEAKAGAIKGGKNLVITVASPNQTGSLKIDSAVVTVTDGDLVIASADELKFEDNRLTIPIKGESRKASTIKITDIKYTVDRTVVKGDLKVSVGGTAINEFADLAALNPPASNHNLYPDFTNAATRYSEFGSAAASSVNATVVTPAPDEVKEVKVVSKFTVGSTSYTVGGETKAMDVAPFVDAGRTYLPIRYAAYAVGVSEDAVLWDAATRTATFLKGDRVVQLTADSAKMLVNGAPITMDVPTKVVNGRLVVPIRWVGIAFGCTVDWDANAQTVTITR